MKREVTVSTAWGLGSTLILGLLILIGSRNLAHFDAALVAYTASVLFATFGLTYRYVMWLQRPPTAVYWKRGWQTFFKRGHRSRNLGSWVSHLTITVCSRPQRRSRLASGSGYRCTGRPASRMTAE